MSEDRLPQIKTAVDQGLGILLGEDDIAWLVREVERLREALPAEVVADPRSVREQALALHKVLPLPVSGEQAG